MIDAILSCLFNLPHNFRLQKISFSMAMVFQVSPQKQNAVIKDSDYFMISEFVVFQARQSFTHPVLTDKSDACPFFSGRECSIQSPVLCLCL